MDGFELLQAGRHSDQEKGDNLRVASLAKDNESGDLAGKLDTLPFSYC